MTSVDLQRISAAAAVLAGALLAAGQILNAAAGDPGSAIADVLVIISHIAYIFAIVGIGLTIDHQRILAASATVLGVVGTTVIAAIVFTGLGEFAGLDLDALRDYAPAAVIGGAGPIAYVVGLALLGIATIRSASLPTLAGGGLVLGALLVVLSGPLGPAAFVAGTVTIGAATIWLAVPMWQVAAPQHR